MLAQLKNVSLYHILHTARGLGSCIYSKFGARVFPITVAFCSKASIFFTFQRSLMSSEHFFSPY